MFALMVAGQSDGSQTPPTIAFKRDTFAFANDTVFAYKDGHPSLRRDDAERYTARCFVMSRAVVQFKKFARFEPNLPPLEDSEMAERIREVTRRPPWDEAHGENERIVIPGVRTLRELSNTAHGSSRKISAWMAHLFPSRQLAGAFAAAAGPTSSDKSPLG